MIDSLILGLAVIFLACGVSVCSFLAIKLLGIKSCFAIMGGYSGLILLAYVIGNALR
jgi:hypothetical protein